MKNTLCNSTQLKQIQKKQGQAKQRKESLIEMGIEAFIKPKPKMEINIRRFCNNK